MYMPHCLELERESWGMEGYELEQEAVLVMDLDIFQVGSYVKYLPWYLGIASATLKSSGLVNFT